MCEKEGRRGSGKERVKWEEWVGLGGLGQFTKLPAVTDCVLSATTRLTRSLTSVMTLKYHALS